MNKLTDEEHQYLMMLKYNATVKTTIEFPAATIKTFMDGRCLEYSKICLCLSPLKRSRNYVAKAIKILRQKRNKQ